MESLPAGSKYNGALANEIAYFVRQLGTVANYDVVVAIERKGLALLRMLGEDYSGQGLVPPSPKLMSYDALEYLDTAYFQDKAVLIFDDSVFSGATLSEATDRIRESDAAKVDTASLFVARNCRCEPTFALYRDLSLPDYGRMRDELIRYISSSDTLLLDTEHTPVRVSTNVTQSEFLRRLTHVDDVLHIPQLSRVNGQCVSIHHPQFFDAKALCSALQPHSSVDGVVVKLRAIVYDNTVWLIPMVFPSTPTMTSPEHCPLFREEPRACICTLANPNKHPNAFYCQSFYAGARLLARTLAVLTKQ